MNKLIVKNSKLKKASGEYNELDILSGNLHENNFESFDIIECVGVFELKVNLRSLLKKIDSLIKIKGQLKIEYFHKPEEMYVGSKGLFRPFSFFMYEFSLTLGSRYKLLKKTVKGQLISLVFEKSNQTLMEGDSIEKWSFGIVSGGTKVSQIQNIINQIRLLRIPYYEIIICGPLESSFSGSDLIQISDDLITNDIRIPITKKKNLIIRRAKYENLVILHDRISFPSSWYSQIKSYGNYFEVLSMKILNHDMNKRVQDWLYLKGDFNYFNKIESGIVNYDKWNPYLYIDGGFIVIKTSIIKKILYNENLHWGEAEDVDLARRLYSNGNLFEFDVNNFVFTETHRHNGVSIHSQSILKKIILKSYFFKFWSKIIYSIRDYFELKKFFAMFNNNTIS
jgi:hypothetical protein